MSDDEKWSCLQLYEWARLRAKADRENGDGDLADALEDVELAITKSCLLDRMVHHHEKPSQTPCPVHKGRWSGIQWGWPGSVEVNLTTGQEHPTEPSESCLEDVRKGCRCFLHSCGCTTGWQPDEHCGCLARLEEFEALYAEYLKVH